MIDLVVGADRELLRLLLLREEGNEEWTDERTVQARTDQASVDAFLCARGLTWQDIDRFVFLVTPRSKTTGRVLKTLVATSAWYLDRPLVLVPGETVRAVTLDAVQAGLNGAGTRFEEQVLRESE